MKFLLKSERWAQLKCQKGKKLLLIECININNILTDNDKAIQYYYYQASENKQTNASGR